MYEAVTGDTAEDDKSLWDQFYKKKNLVYGKEPISFLKDHIGKIKRGRALVLAMGEGRNAIYLAKHGFKVEGNDISEVAIQKALTFAKESRVSIKATVADLKNTKLPENQYEFILMSLYFDPSLVAPIKKALSKGGLVMFYNKLDLPKQLNNSHSVRGAPDEFSVKPGELRTYFEDFEILVYREYLDGGDRVAAILAKKPFGKKDTP